MTDYLSRMAEERYGIKTDSSDVQKLEGYIQKTYGAETQEILDRVFSSGEAAGFLTVGETYFFREPLHFTFLNSFLPSFEKTGMSGGDVPLRICSAAVSAGCEAYSIAMLIEAYNRGSENPIRYHIDAFDINPTAIDAAVRGVYSERTMREDGNSFHYMTVPYLKKAASSADTGGMPRLLIEDSLKKNIRFFVHNLMDEIPPEQYHFIFFRNAFIYFSPQNRERALSNLSAALKDGGILIMGVSETAAVNHPDLDEKNQGDVFYFQKPVYKKAIVV